MGRLPQRRGYDSAVASYLTGPQQGTAATDRIDQTAGPPIIRGDAIGDAGGEGRRGGIVGAVLSDEHAASLE